MALLHVDFFSDVLGMGMNMDVILPQKTSKQIGMEGMAADGSYKTVYLLHGMSDDHTVWQRRTAIERYLSRLGIAVVMPSTHLGFYTDTVYGMRYWTFVSERGCPWAAMGPGNWPWELRIPSAQRRLCPERWTWQEDITKIWQRKSGRFFRAFSAARNS